MANVKVNMERGDLTVRGEAAVDDPVRLRMKSVPDDLRERLKALDKRKRALAGKRGPWKDATPKQRAEAKAVAAEIAEVKAEMRAAADTQRQAELDKQAAAAKLESARRGEG